VDELVLGSKLRCVITVFAALSISACAVEVSSGATDDDVLDHVEAIGFDRDSAEIVGNVVRVDGDMVLYRDALLAGAYETSDAPEGVVEKGYRYSTLVSSGRRGNVKLAFATGGRAPSSRIRNAFISAADAWSEIPGSTVRIDASNTGPAITVHMINALDWPEGSRCSARSVACAEVPMAGRPGANVWIMSCDTFANCRDWSTSSLSQTARHELGHAMGFAHPKEVASVRVSGTRACTGSVSTCAVNPGYSTVMSTPAAATRCEVTPALLTQDDYATCAATY
jgi:hypothetical protein